MSPRVKKYLLVAGIVVIGVVLDQWTKWIAADRLANARMQEGHAITIRVPDSADGETLRSYLADEFSSNRPDEIDRIAEHFVYGPDGKRLSPTETVEADQLLEVVHRTVTVIPGYWEFEYAENRGAAFSMLSESDSPWRMPFLIGVSLFAVVVIIYLLEGVRWADKAMIVALAFIATGAVGNLIDRIHLGYVIDFIVWKYTDQYRWPSFNVADAFITVGVVVMLALLLFGEHPEEGEAAEQPSG
ncbi:MAG: signal peptidase II [Bradymonadaceae bacterium]